MSRNIINNSCFRPKSVAGRRPFSFNLSLCAAPVKAIKIKGNTKRQLNMSQIDSHVSAWPIDKTASECSRQFTFNYGQIDFTIQIGLIQLEAVESDQVGQNGNESKCRIDTANSLSLADVN